jgi:hypothetical protein
MSENASGAGKFRLRSVRYASRCIGGIRMTNVNTSLLRPRGLPCVSEPQGRYHSTATGIFITIMETSFHAPHQQQDTHAKDIAMIYCTGSPVSRLTLIFHVKYLRHNVRNIRSVILFQAVTKRRVRGLLGDYAIRRLGLSWGLQGNGPISIHSTVAMKL